MSDQNQPHKEVDLFQAISIRDIEERDELHGSSDLFDLLQSIAPGVIECWCGSKSPGI